MATYADLNSAAATIKSETVARANSATRVGTMLESVIASFAHKDNSPNNTTVLKALSVAGGGATVDLVSTDSSDRARFGGAGAVAVDLYAGGSTALRATSATVDIQDRGLVTTGYASLGTTPADAGEVRLKSVFAVNAKRELGAGNVGVLSKDSADRVQLGGTNAVAVDINAGGSLAAAIGATSIDFQSRNITTTGKSTSSAGVHAGYDDVLVNPTAAAVLAAMTSGTAAKPKRYRVIGTVTVAAATLLSALNYIEVHAYGAQIEESYAPSTGDADSSANSLFRAAATLAGSLTTLAATAQPGATSITVVSTTGLSVGNWILLHSRNDSNVPSGASGDLNDVYSLYKIASLPGGGVIGLESPIRWWAYTGATSTVERVTNVPTGIKWFGGDFNCSGGTIACAFSFETTLDCEVSRAKFTGFSRAAVVAEKGCAGFIAEANSHGGECNGVLYFESSHDVKVPTFYSPTYAALKKHAYGYPRALITFRARCQAAWVGHADLQWGSIGFEDFGSDHSRVDSLFIDNIDLTNITAVASEGRVSTQVGAYNSGATSLTQYTSFGTSNTVGHITIGPSITFGATQCGIYWHDKRSCTLGGVTYSNNGAANSFVLLVISDCFDGSVQNIKSKGAYTCIRTENQCTTRVFNIQDENAAGSGSNTGPLFRLEHGNSGGLEMEFRDIFTNNRSALFSFSATFAHVRTVFRNIHFDTAYWPISEVFPVYNNTGVTMLQYETWALESLNGDGFPQPSTPSAGGAQKSYGAVLKGLNDLTTNNNYVMMQRLGPGFRAMVNASGATAYKDALRHSTATIKSCDVDNGAPLYEVLGYARRTTAGVGAVPIGWD